MAAKVLVLYKPPTDVGKFDRYYFETHVPIARKIPRLRGMTFNAGPIMAMAGTAPHLIAELEFDSMADLRVAMESPEGLNTAADLRNFAEDPTVLICETRLDQP